MKKVLFLFNAVRTGKPEITKNHYYGMYELREHGFETHYLEIEHFWPKKICEMLRKKILTMHFAHIPLFFKFFTYDIVFTSTAYGSLLLKTLFNVKKFKWVVLDFNILGTIGTGKSLKQKLFKWMISKVDGIVTISEAEKEGLENMFPHLEGNIVFIHEATDLESFVPQEPELHVKPYVLTVGKYGRDFDTVVQALKDTSVNVKIATKPSLVTHLEPLPTNMTSKLYSHNEMRNLYKNAALVIVAVKPTFTTDSVGTLSVGEAMAMKKAVVATDTLSMRSYIIPEINGRLVEAGNPEEMQKAVINLIDDAIRRNEIAENGYRFAIEKLSLDHFSKKLAVFLTKL